MTTLNTLATFQGTNGANPVALLLDNATGDVFGISTWGGTSGAGGGVWAEPVGYGTTFEIPKINGAYASAPTTLAAFNGANAAYPSSLIADPAGNLFGTTGGTTGYGTVFEIANTVTGYASTPTTLVSFNVGPYATPSNLTADAAGNLFGLTHSGGANGYGMVFEIPKTPSGYATTPTPLITFTSTTGYGANLIADALGNLFYENTVGPSGYLRVLEIPRTPTGYASTPTTLVTFDGSTGPITGATLIADAAGNLFGVSPTGGLSGQGLVFEIAKTPGGYANTPTVLVNFDPSMIQPGPVIVDAAGNLFGTTRYGGASNAGTAYEIAKTPDGYATAPTILVSFPDTPNANPDYLTNGGGPISALVADAAGNLFGTTGLWTSFGHVVASYGTVFELTNTGFQVACYLRGTRIATPTGPRPIEHLAPGDLVLTASGTPRPIAWLGARRIAAHRHPHPEQVWPIHIHPHSFGPGLPSRSLFLSPDHAVHIDGVLIPIRYLVNGATIRQHPHDDITYFHLELASHDVILAESLPCETYLDTGNRGAFANGGPAIHLHPDFALAVWHAKSCAPLIVEGAHLEAARSYLLERAHLLGHRTTSHPALALLANGRLIPPEPLAHRHRFRLPPGTTTLRLLSRGAIPAHLHADCPDHRQLGIAVAAIIADGTPIPLTDPRLGTGWHQPETGTLAPAWRWTNGDAALALAGITTLEIEIAMTARYWSLPPPIALRA